MTTGGKTTLRVDLTEPATPARVALVATFVDRMIAATHPHLKEGDVTLEIANFSTKASVHARTAAAKSALQLALRFLENPVKTVKRQQARGRELAEVMASVGDSLSGAVFSKTRGKPIATIDDTFVQLMRGIARSTPQPGLRGRTHIESPVLRVGRAGESKRPAIRVHIAGGVHDVRIKDGVSSAPFFDAAKKGGVHRIHLDARWLPVGAGKQYLDVGRTRATMVEPVSRPISGRDFVDQVHAESPDLFDDIESVLQELEGR